LQFAPTVFVVAVALGGLAGLGLLVRYLQPTTLFCLGLAAQVFSSNSKYMHFPIGPDRILFAAAILSLFIRRRNVLSLLGRSQIHFLMVALMAYIAVSAIAFGTMFQSLGFFAFLDRVGIMPFLAFILAPAFFETPEQRRLLVRTLVFVGLYLGVTAVFETLKLWSLVFPRYISNPNLGIHYGRARGPFLEATTEGLVLIACTCMAGIAFLQSRTKTARVIYGLLALLCVVASLLTLTRSVWIAVVVGPGVALLISKATRKFVIPAAACLVIVALTALVVSPSLQDSVRQRSASQLSVWDRYNTNDAALRAIDAHPVFGVGFARFIDVSGTYLRQSGSYPLTGSHLEVHNVFLARFSELGILGGTLWSVTVATALYSAIRRKGDGEFVIWRQALIGYVIAYGVVAMFAPTSAAMPNMLFWLFAGIVYSALPAQASASVKTQPLRISPATAGVQAVSS
jgi:putative inorganic carbon (hco3(-)) transporter